MANYGFPRRKFEVKVSNENDPPPLNWRRGLFRVWVLVSISWVMGWAIYVIITSLESGFKSTGEVLALPVLLFGPPVALLLFGMATRWAIQGFKGEPGPPKQ